MRLTPLACLSRWAPVCAVLLAACAGGASPAGSPPRPPAASVDNAEALLLYLADRQVYEAFTAELVLGEHPELHAELALALGRIGDVRGAGVLRALLRSPSVEARRAAAFALGLLGEPGSVVDLLTSTVAGDRQEGRLAVEALARLGAPLERISAVLEALPEQERLARLLPSLFRFDPEEILPLARIGLASPDPEAQRWAAYAISRKAAPAGAPELRLLLRDTRPWLRGWAARALGNVGEAADLALLRPLLGEAEPGPVIQALRAARNLIARGRAAPPEAWAERLIELSRDDRPGVRITALEAAGAWPGGTPLADLLAGVAESAGGREREVALLALAEAGDDRAPELVRRAALDEDPVLRARAAEAAGGLGATAVLDRLLEDPVAGVRLAALGERIGGAAEGESLSYVRLALADEDEAVRATALDWLAESPVVEVQELTLAFSRPRAGRLLDLPVGLARALAARGLAEPLERGAVVAALEALAADPELLVRRAAGDALVRLDRPRPPIGAAETGRNLRYYSEQLAVSDRPRLVDLETGAGTIRLRLDCARARLTCLNFMQLVNQGFYDGLTFHRVVPDFVVQGGDPRGDGWGGPGYSIRDENNLARFESGVVGMALSGPHTGGSQFFITLAPQPHLDGTFTAFGEVVGGWEALDRIVQGDRIERMIEAEPVSR